MHQLATGANLTEGEVSPDLSAESKLPAFGALPTFIRLFQCNWRVDNADIFIFLASQDSVTPGSYALTELAFAEAKWRNPAGYILPVVTNNFDSGALPAYLRPINALQIRGNLEAEVVAWVEERAAKGGGGGLGQLTPEDRLKQWARFSQPPIRRARGIPCSSIGMLFVGAVFMVFAVVPGILGQNDSFFQVFFFFCGFVRVVTGRWRCP